MKRIVEVFPKSESKDDLYAEIKLLKDAGIIIGMLRGVRGLKLLDVHRSRDAFTYLVDYPESYDEEKLEKEAEFFNGFPCVDFRKPPRPQLSMKYIRSKKK